MPRGIRQAGIPEVPHNINDRVSMRRFLQEIRNTLQSVVGERVPPKAATSLRVTPKGGQNEIEFVRSDADFYLLYISTTPEISDGYAVPMGAANRFVDVVGEVGIRRFYWVEAYRAGGIKGGIIGPESGTTLALTTGVTPPIVLPSREFPALDEERGDRQRLLGEREVR
ncbi:MAG: hypothetical protein V3S55_13845 [Nitrospiraceae bacterium]